MSKPTVAIITTCKDRLHHLQRTLPAMVAQKPDEVIVVDYDCPQHAGDWVEAHVPRVQVVRNPGAHGFNLGRARNLGAAETSSQWLLFVDADVVIQPGLIETLRAGVETGAFYTPQPANSADAQLFGSLCCRTRDFVSVRGYDEMIEGWGFEDQDLRERLKLLGLREIHYARELLDPIAHDDSERFVRSDMQDRFQNEAINACYAKAKHAITIAKGRRATQPIEERRNLMIECRRLVGQWYAGGCAEQLDVRFVVDRGKRVSLGTGMGVNLDVAVTVTLMPPQRQIAQAAKPDKPRRAKKAPAAAVAKKGVSR